MNKAKSKIITPLASSKKNVRIDSTSDPCEGVSSNILTFFETDLSTKDLFELAENYFVIAVKRNVGFKIMHSVIHCHSQSSSLLKNIILFCAALRSGVNKIVSYKDKLKAIGSYNELNLQKSFFGVISSIAHQLTLTDDTNLIMFLLSCLKWKFSQSDLPFLVKSNIFNALKNGNGIQDYTKNPIKYAWGHKFTYRNTAQNEEISEMLIDTFEFIATSVLSSLVSNRSKHSEESKESHLDLDSPSKDSTAKDKSDAAMSVINVIVWQLNRYCEYVNNFNPVDYKLFVKMRNEHRVKGTKFAPEESEYLEDELNLEQTEALRQEELKIEEEKEKKRQEDGQVENALKRDRIQEIVKDRTEKELKKLTKMYDQVYVSKLLRLLETFTTVAQTNLNVRHHLEKALRGETLALLLRLLVTSQARHGIIVVKILTNVVNLGIVQDIIQNSEDLFSTDGEFRKVMGIESHVTFEGAKFLEFCFKFCLSALNPSDSSNKLSNSGHYYVLNAVKHIFHNILSSDESHGWKSITEGELDKFMKNIDSYSVHEFDVMSCLLEGGDYRGLGVGCHGIAQDSKMFTILGFVENWYGLSAPGKQLDDNNFDIKKISYEYRSNDYYILGSTFDKKNPKKSDLIIVVPDQVTLITNLHNKSSDYLLSEERLKCFFEAFKIDQIPDKNNAISLSKRCVGMKILVNQIETNGDKLAQHLDPNFKNKLIELLLVECTSLSEGEQTLPCDWYEQKLYAIKKLAVERQIPLANKSDISIHFLGKRLCLTKSLKISPNEIYNESMSLFSAMNYGRIEQRMKYHIINEEDLRSNLNPLDKVAVINSSSLETPESIISAFKHVDIIISSDIDLKIMHDQLVVLDKNTAFFKTLILVSKENISNLKKLIISDPEVKVASNDEMSLHQTFINEMSVFCNLEKSELEKALENQENATLPSKISTVIKSLSEVKDKKKEEDEKKKKEESKLARADTKSAALGLLATEALKVHQETKAAHSKNELKIEDDPYYLYGLDNNPYLTSNINELAAFADNNYNPPQNQSKESKQEMFSKVYLLSEDTIIIDYLKTLATFYKQLCRKTISSFFQGLSLENLFDFIFKNEENMTRFQSYVLMKASEANATHVKTKNEEQINDFIDLVVNMAKSGKENPQYSELINTFYTKCIVKNTKDVLIEAVTKKNKEVFSNEANVSKALIPWLIPRTIKAIQSVDPNFVYNHSEHFANLISVLFTIPMVLRMEFELQNEIYILIYKLLMPVAKNPEKFDTILKVGVLRMRIFKKIIEKCNFDVSVSRGDKLTSEQKLLFEIFSLIHQIDTNMVEYWSLYTYTDILLELEKCRVVLREGKEFDMIGYLLYFNNELSGPQQHTKVYADTFHSMFEGKISAKIQFEGFKKMTFRLDEVSKIKDDTYVGVSSDPEGESILTKISQKDIEKGNTSHNIYFNECYIHYPYNPCKIIGFGDGSNNVLGNDNTGRTEATEFKNFVAQVQMIGTGDCYTVVMDPKGNMFFCGNKSSMGDSNTTMKKYTKKTPDEKVLMMKTGPTNVVLLTEDHKIYIEGYDYYYHISTYSQEQYEFKHKKRPDEEDEKVIDLNVGKNGHAYITDNGKLYCAGSELTQAFDIYCNGPDYKQITLEEGLVPKRVFCGRNNDTPRVI
jgi:hypothetical protein